MWPEPKVMQTEVTVKRTLLLISAKNTYWNKEQQQKIYQA